MLNVSGRRLYQMYTSSIIIAALGIAMISIPNLNSNPLASFEEEEHKFTAKMKGSEEVPPKNTQATGTAKFIQP